MKSMIKIAVALAIFLMAVAGIAMAAYVDEDTSTAPSTDLSMGGHKITDLDWSNMPVYVYTGTTTSGLASYISTNGEGRYQIVNDLTGSTELDISTDNVMLEGRPGKSIAFSQSSGTGIHMNADHVVLKDLTVNASDADTTMSLVVMGFDTGDYYAFWQRIEGCNFNGGHGNAIDVKRLFYGEILNSWMIGDCSTNDRYGAGIKFSGYGGCIVLRDVWAWGYYLGFHVTGMSGLYFESCNVYECNTGSYMENWAGREIGDYIYDGCVFDFCHSSGVAIKPYMTDNIITRARLHDTHVWVQDTGYMAIQVCNATDVVVDECWLRNSGSYDAVYIEKRVSNIQITDSHIEDDNGNSYAIKFCDTTVADKSQNIIINGDYMKPCIGVYFGTNTANYILTDNLIDAAATNNGAGTFVNADNIII